MRLPRILSTALAPIAAALVLLTAAAIPPSGLALPPHRAGVAFAAQGDVVNSDPKPRESDLARSSKESAPSALVPTGTATATPTATSAPQTTATVVPGEVVTVPILMYHYIRELPPNTPDKLGYGLSVAPRLFEEQLKYLAGANYQSISMDLLVARILHGTPLPPKPIVLSFDDGYADFYSNALPLLRQYHFTATTYLVVDFLGRPGYMTWQQANELSQTGIEIGAHTLDHVDLAIQPLPQARRQITDSRTILRQRLGQPVNTFAYPSGRYNQTTLKVVADAGFSSAVTTAFGGRHTAKNLLTLSRIRVPGGISLQGFIKNLGA